MVSVLCQSRQTIHNSARCNIDIQLHAAVLTIQYHVEGESGERNTIAVITNVRFNTNNQDWPEYNNNNNTKATMHSLTLSWYLSSPLLCVRLYDKEFQRKITVTGKISSLIYS